MTGSSLFQNGCVVTLGVLPVTLSPPAKKHKETRKKLPPRLVLKNGRLTRGFWMLKEGLTQDIRHSWIGGVDRRYCWQEARWLDWLISKKYIEKVRGPRNGDRSYRTTGEGAFAMLMAEGLHNHLKEKRGES